MPDAGGRTSRRPSRTGVSATAASDLGRAGHVAPPWPWIRSPAGHALGPRVDGEHLGPRRPRAAEATAPPIPPAPAGDQRDPALPELTRDVPERRPGDEALVRDQDAEQAGAQRAGDRLGLALPRRRPPSPAGRGARVSRGMATARAFGPPESTRPSRSKTWTTRSPTAPRRRRPGQRPGAASAPEAISDERPRRPARPRRRGPRSRGRTSPPWAHRRVGQQVARGPGPGEVTAGAGSGNGRPPRRSANRQTSSEGPAPGSTPTTAPQIWTTARGGPGTGGRASSTAWSVVPHATPQDVAGPEQVGQPVGRGRRRRGRVVAAHHDGEGEPELRLQRRAEVVVDRDRLADLDPHDALGAGLLQHPGDLEARDPQPVGDLGLGQPAQEVQARGMGLGGVAAQRGAHSSTVLHE